MTVYAPPARTDSLVSVESRYGHFIGGDWVDPKKGAYFETSRRSTASRSPRSPAAPRRTSRRPSTPRTPPPRVGPDVGHRALPHPAPDRRPHGGEPRGCSPSPRPGRTARPVRETLAADLPLAVDHFRYFAGVLRGQEGSIGEIDENTVAYHFHEPLGVVGQIIPWNFPILMAVWKLAPALAAGNCGRAQARRADPVVDPQGDRADRRPAAGGRAQRRQRLRRRGRQAAGLQQPRIAKIAFTGETTTGRLIMQYASQNIIPVTLELGGKSPNVFFDDVASERDAFYDKALEGFTMFALNQGEVCTCPSRALVQRRSTPTSWPTPSRGSRRSSRATRSTPTR